MKIDQLLNPPTMPPLAKNIEQDVKNNPDTSIKNKLRPHEISNKKCRREKGVSTNNRLVLTPDTTCQSNSSKKFNDIMQRPRRNRTYKEKIKVKSSRKQLNAQEDRQCFYCKSTKTPEWRKTKSNNILCNACGLRYRNKYLKPNIPFHEQTAVNNTYLNESTYTDNPSTIKNTAIKNLSFFSNSVPMQQPINNHSSPPLLMSANLNNTNRFWKPYDENTLTITSKKKNHEKSNFSESSNRFMLNTANNIPGKIIEPNTFYIAKNIINIPQLTS